MTPFRISLSVGTAAFGLILAAAPVRANLVSYVSLFGGDNDNTCAHPGSPCFSIAGALAKTEPGGEIKCLDNHQDGAFEIEKPVTIDCGAPGTWILGASSNTGITVNLNEATYPNGVVTLRNLNISGLLGNSSRGSGTDGIRVIGGGAAVHIENCSILGFAEQGIDFAPTSSVDLFIRDTTISNNAGGGVFVHPATVAAVRGALGNVSLDRNGHSGLSIGKTGGELVDITVEGTQIEKNGIGLRANGASAAILLSGSTVAHNKTGLASLNGGKITSLGNNVIARNATNGAPTSAVSLK